MSIPGRAEAAVKGLVLSVAVGMVVLAVVIGGLGFLIAGFFLWIERYQPHDAAAAITGGVLFILAMIIALTGRAMLRRIKKKQPPLLSEFTGIFATAGRIAGLLIRKDPRKSMVIAIVAGALAEYITSGDKKRK
jgi:O-antigen/teichoic acid export membrane protein